MRKLSDRYRKVLVTVAMGFRSEDDVRKNGLYIFTKDKKDKLIKYINDLFLEKHSVLALKIGMRGFHSKHILIKSDDDLNNFIASIDDIFNGDNEIWVVSSSVINCFRGRIYLSRDGLSDYIEMSYSSDDHVLDHIIVNKNELYVCFKKDFNVYQVCYTSMDNEMLKEVRLIIRDILNKYSDLFERIRSDLNILGINGISLDVRVNNGYDFHDFDVNYEDVDKVINYYLDSYL